jgi:hypothetical protein
METYTQGHRRSSIMTSYIKSICFRGGVMHFQIQYSSYPRYDNPGFLLLRRQHQFNFPSATKCLEPASCPQECPNPSHSSQGHSGLSDQHTVLLQSRQDANTNYGLSNILFTPIELGHLSTTELCTRLMPHHLILLWRNLQPCFQVQGVLDCTRQEVDESWTPS